MNLSTGDVALIVGVLGVLGTILTAYMGRRGKQEETADHQEAALRKEYREERDALKLQNRGLEKANRLLEQQNEQLQHANELLQQELNAIKAERAVLIGKVQGLEQDVIRLNRKVGELENGRGGK
jgi:predicted nuclease with TOPRIM domain